jgi:hypothetical protein
MANCFYKACDYAGAVGDDGLCPRCRVLTGDIEQRVSAGRLPQKNIRAVTPRTRPLPLPRGGMPCAGCDQTIDGAHPEYPNYPNPRSTQRAELHFHDLCHEIWSRIRRVT